MIRIDIQFDTSALDNVSIEKLSAEMDNIFERQEMICIEKQFGKRIYQDKGRLRDDRRCWAAIFAIKDNSCLVDNITKATWFDGENEKDLITDFLKYKKGGN